MLLTVFPVIFTASLKVVASFADTKTPPPAEAAWLLEISAWPLIIILADEFDSLYTPPPFVSDLFSFISPPDILNVPVALYTPPPDDVDVLSIIAAPPDILNVPAALYTPPPPNIFDVFLVIVPPDISNVPLAK